MLKQTIVWTSLPHGIDGPVAEGATLRISVLASPRLWNDDPAVGKMQLSDFPDFLDWPHVVEEASFEVEFSGGPTVAASSDTGPPDAQAWGALFKGSTDVVPFVFEDLSGAELLTFPEIEIHDRIKVIYQTAAIGPQFGGGSDLPDGGTLGRDPDFGGLARPVRPERPFVPDNPDRGPVILDRPEPPPGPPAGEPAGCLRRVFDLLLIPVRIVVALIRRLLKALGVMTMLAVAGVFSSMGDGMRLSGDVGDVGKSSSTGAGGGAGGPQPGNAGPGGQPSSAAFDELREYMSPTSPVSHPLPTAPEIAETYDFHKMIAALGDYPLLLRRLGLVVDLVVTIPPGGLPATGTVRVIPSVTLSTPTTNHTPKTHYELHDDRFLARPRVADADLANGLLRLQDRARFQIQQIDVVGGGIKLQNAATNIVGLQTLGEVPVNEPAEQGLPALQSASISIVRPDVRSWLKERFRRSYALNAFLATVDHIPIQPLASGETPPDKDDELFAEDLIRGYRVDVRDDHAGRWLSLCQRSGTYRFLELGGVPPSSETDEGFVQPSTTEALDPGATRVLRAHGTVFAWDGWSLAGPRPGESILPGGTTHGDVENHAATAFGLEVTYSAVPGSLPRLRYGHRYRLRARIVDLAGNSVFDPETPSFDADQDEVSPEFMFRRFEPIPPPPVMLRAEPKEGESLERMTVRSAVPDPAPRVEAQITERHLGPPKGAQLLAERHGRFDGASDMLKGPAGYALASREAGSLTERLDAASGTLEPLAGVSEVTDLSQRRTYWLQTNETFEATYLPDPYARGVLLLGLPGMGPLEVTDGVNRLPFAGSWPELRSVLLRLQGVRAGALPAAPHWDSADKVLTVQLPQGETARVRLASYFHADDLDTMGIWGWTEEAAPPNLADLRTRAVEGRNWLHLPFRELTLVHAVQQPLAIPEITLSVLNRGLGETAVSLAGELGIDAKSTGKVDLLAAWADPRDDPTDPANDPASERTEHRMHVRELVLADESDDTPSISDIVKAMGDAQCALHHQVGDTKYHLHHQVGDTKYHRVTYTPIASTRFREHFPAAITADPDALRRPLGSEAPISFQLDVPNTRRPDAPRPVYTLPIFRWRETHSGSIRTRVREGGGLRVYMERPWFSSGDGELLGILMRTADPPLDGSEGEKIRKYTSEWGLDPLWNAAETAPLRSADFANVKEPGSDLSIAELPGILVNVAGFEVAYDPSRQLWYADIEVRVEGHYFPFLRLALARYQPLSVDDAHLSPIVLSDFTQVVPHRTAEYDLGSAAANGSIPIRLSGPGHLGSDGPGFGATFVVARLERRAHGDHDADEPVGWEPFQTISLERSMGSGYDVVWEGTLQLPDPLPAPLRVSIYEAQVLRTDGRPVSDVLGLLERDGAANAGVSMVGGVHLAETPDVGYRIVYADATVVSP